MNDMRNKIFSLLVLLMTAATGAWAQDYYLIGTMNDWCPSRQFQLTQNPYNTDEYMITLTLNEDAEFKVIGVDGEGNWTWYPGGSDPNYVVPATGEYTVYFRHNYSGDDKWYYGCIYAPATPAPAIPVTDLGSNTWQFTMPDYAVVANIEYDTDLELREENVNTTVLADWDGYEADINLKRTLKAGSWNTFAIPYDISSGFLNILKIYYPITAVKELTGATLTDGTLNLTFDNATSIEAGKPYLVMVESDFDLSTMAVAEVVKATPKPFISDAVDFIPTLGKTTIPAGDVKNVLFMTSGGNLKHPTTLPADIKGFRAYFQLKGDAVNAASFNLDFGNGETTGINNLNVNDNDNLDNATPMYNTAGQRVNKSYKGIVIVNGKKMVIK